jgi:hypothetical protein
VVMMEWCGDDGDEDDGGSGIIHSRYLRILQVIGPVLCGPNMNEYEKDPCPDAMYYHQSNSRALVLMLYIMTNKPLIIYSPRGPDIDAVVKRVRRVLQYY